MVCDLEPTILAGQAVWRVAHAPAPWQFTDWAHAGNDGRFDGRWDDPTGSYRVLYTSTSTFGAYVEALANFRADPAVTAGLAEIVTDPDPADADLDVTPPGQVPLSWSRGRVVGHAMLSARCAHLGHSRSLACLSWELSPLVVRHRLDDLDAAAIRRRAPRAFTQHVSRFVYDCTNLDGTPQFEGIHFLSRFGDDLGNIALFEQASNDPDLTDTQASPISLNDPALEAAMDHHGLGWFDDTTA